MLFSYKMSSETYRKTKKEYKIATKSNGHTFRKLASILLAIALANNVLPVPGGPYRRTP